ncbi:MAG: sigma-54-dependent Fis family transcriptional regulator [Candidatus Cloacimonetes bacterium]|nr:sigma-54-dependent Fis family transcriptional regulator [Candidatus Cloacimonadota bacterium]
MRKKILIVEDNPDEMFLLEKILSKQDYILDFADNGLDALKKITILKPHIVLLDIGLPKMDGLTLLKKIKPQYPEVEFIMITASDEIDDAVTALKNRALDYLKKPFNNDELLLIIEKALKSQALSMEVKHLKNRLKKKSDKFIGECPNIKDMLKLVDIIAPTNYSVILQGESGTGKELLAKMIHRKSKRKDKPFIAVDCSTIPETLIESELFGHEKGAFTGATSMKIGKFEQANTGTIFFDEISNLSLKVQAELLRVIQERRIYRIGDDKPVEIDIRIIAATNIELEELIEKKKFREDLFHRIDEFCINIAPLRDRKKDIPILSEYFLQLTNDELGKNIKTISPEAMKELLDHTWTGNVRELKNLIRKAVLLSESEIIRPKNLLFSLNHKENYESDEFNLEKAKKQTEEKIIKKVLNQVAGNRNQAAEILGINRKSLYLKIKEYGIEV